jgi:hypothetical protein
MSFQGALLVSDDLYHDHHINSQSVIAIVSNSYC